MADYDPNIIKPVEGLQNVAGLVPAKGREQRKRRQHPRKENLESTQRERGKSADKQNPRNKIAKNENDRDAIDYCA
jgi:hypothetical protein